MDWIAIVVICIILLFLILNILLNRHGRKSVSRQDTVTLPPKKPSEETYKSKTETTYDKSLENADLSTPEDYHDKHKREGKRKVSREVTTYRIGSESTKTYVRYDWQKRFEKSILTPFPEEWSPALPYLHTAYKLEEEEANQEEIQKVLEKAQQLDKDATAFYLGRMAIIKKVRSENQ